MHIPLLETLAACYILGHRGTGYMLCHHRSYHLATYTMLTTTGSDFFANGELKSVDRCLTNSAEEQREAILPLMRLSWVDVYNVLGVAKLWPREGSQTAIRCVLCLVRRLDNRLCTSRILLSFWACSASSSCLPCDLARHLELAIPSQILPFFRLGEASELYRS